MRSYSGRVASEKARYAECQQVHDLPPIFHYWSDTYIRPKLEPFGFRSPDEIFAKYLTEQYEQRLDRPLRFASVGSGNCNLEIAFAARMVARGYSRFAVDCLELNPAMLKRARAAAARAGVGEQIRLVEVDVNQWTADHEYDAAIANQSLHHILNLEGLFRQIWLCLQPHGCFVISDMIGRNGHLRWPEALDVVHEFWRKMPPSYRFNHSLQRHEELYRNWDCSAESFEGIRSQDILPLLVKTFHFRLFVGFGNVIDPFTDRAFGINFDANAAWDRAFIDQVHRRDEQEMRAGRIKPTHMLAVVDKDSDTATLFHEPFAPAFCVRRTDERADTEEQDAPPHSDSYEWHAWPHSAQTELEIACRRLREAEMRADVCREEAKTFEKQSQEMVTWVQQAERELTERTSWAQGLERELADRTDWARKLERELDERTVWARKFERELDERTDWARKLDRENAELISLAQRLDRELAERTAWAQSLRRELEQFRLRLLFRIAGKLYSLLRLGR